MKKSIFNFIALITLVMVFTACEKRVSEEAHDIHWDRDVCDRCKMVISGRKHAVQVINPESGDMYKFDDIGCAILWFKENNITWKDSAKIWTIDVNTGKWINAKKSYYDTVHKTPMGYGFSANDKKESITDETSEKIDFAEMSKRVIERGR